MVEIDACGKDAEESEDDTITDEEGLKSELEKELIAELSKKGIKHNAEDVIAITKVEKGKIIFLEKGNLSSGWKHIVEDHKNDFEKQGILEENLVDFLVTAVEQNNIIGIQGKNRQIYEVVFAGKTHYVAISIGKNGYIVGANPRSKKEINKKFKKR